MVRLRDRLAEQGMRPWVSAVLLAGAILLTVIGLALLGAYFFLARQPTDQVVWRSPLDLARTEAVAADLAVLTLAGESDDRVIRAALAAGETETAFATLAYSFLLPDTLRSGSWLLLAERYRTTEPDRALACLAEALDLATLGPTLGDMARADISLQVARGLSALDRKPIGRLALVQAENLARYSLTLLPAQRRELLSQVAAAYAAVGDAQTAALIQAQLDVASAGPGVKLEPPPLFLSQLRGGISLPQSVTAAVIARQQAAATLAARWLTTAPSARPGLADALGQALLAEDAARQAFYSAASDLTPADQLALLYDRIAWLLIKYRAARGGYGVVLVPAWQEQVETIRNELVAAFTDLVNGYGRQLDTLPPAESNQARVELLRQGLLWTRLGLFPADVEEPLREQLIEASQQLWLRQGGVGLTIVAQELQGWRFYLLAGAAASPPTPVRQ